MQFILCFKIEYFTSIEWETNVHTVTIHEMSAIAFEHILFTTNLNESV